MSVTERLDAFQRRHPGAGFPIAVAYKFFDDQGSYLAALITYYALLSVFPLLLLLSTVLGLVLAGDAHLQKQVLDSAVGQFPGLRDDLGQPKRIGGGTTGLVVGIVGALYGGLGVAQATQHAMNTAWAVPRNDRPNPFKARGRSLLLLGTVGLAVIGTTALSALAARFASGLTVLSLAGSVLLNAGVFLLAFRLATTRELSVRDVLPGALAAAVLWQVLQSVGASYVDRVSHSSSATNGAFGLVLGVIAFLYLASVVVVLCVEVNVVRVEGLSPRALLTPFTDDVQLTQGDEDAYAGQAKAQRSKGFEEIDVSFERGERD